MTTNPTARRWAERGRRRLVTRPHRPQRPIPNQHLNRLWKPLPPATSGPYGSRLVRGPWNGLRAVTARSWPPRCTGRRHRRTHRAVRAVWTVGAVLALAVAVVVALAGLVAWPAWWTARTVIATGLILAGWTPPTIYDPTAIDPTRALFDDDTEHHHPPTLRPPPRPTPAPTPPAVSLEERQVAAAEANASALHQLALAEAARPAPAPVLTWHHQPTGPNRAKRALVVLAVFYAAFVLLLMAGANARRNNPALDQPPAIDQPETGQ